MFKWYPAVLLLHSTSLQTNLQHKVFRCAEWIHYDLISCCSETLWGQNQQRAFTRASHSYGVDVTDNHPFLQLLLHFTPLSPSPCQLSSPVGACVSPQHAADTRTVSFLLSQRGIQSLQSGHRSGPQRRGEVREMYRPSGTWSRRQGLFKGLCGVTACTLFWRQWWVHLKPFGCCSCYLLSAHVR